MRIRILMFSSCLITLASATMARADVIRSSDCLPPISSQYDARTVQGFHQGWPEGSGTITFSDPQHSQFNGCTSPKSANPGDLTIDAFGLVGLQPGTDLPPGLRVDAFLIVDETRPTQ